MGLRAELTVKIDAGSLVQGLLTSLGGPAGRLAAVSVPESAGELTAVASATADVDASAIGQAVVRVAEQAAPLLASLPVAGDVMRSLTVPLELVEQVTAEDLPSQLGDLVARLSEELEGTREGGLVGILLRLAEILSSAPEGRLVLSLLTSLTASTALPAAPLGRLAELLPALDGAVRVLGGLMTLESVLSESERLTAVMAGHLDPAVVRRQADLLLACFDAGQTPLSELAATAPADDPLQVEAVISGLTVCADRFEELHATLATAMGFGEATLAYLDVGQVQAEVEGAIAVLRGADLAPLERTLAAALSGLQPFLSFDLRDASTHALDDLLHTVEDALAGHVARIEAFDPAVITQPLADGIGRVTGVAEELTARIHEITVAVRAALDRVKGILTALPFEEITAALQSVLAPVTAALDRIREIVADVQAALDTAARNATEAIEQVEDVVDGFKTDVEALFAQASTFVEGLDLESVVGEVAGRVQQFSDLLAQAEMKPYFDTAVDVIGTTADVVAAVPFGLLPESMKADVDAAVRPIRQTDVRAVEREVEGLLGITADGKFELRGDLEDAVAEIQEKYDALLAAIREHDPRRYLQQIDTELARLAQRIRDISPQLALEPVRDAIQQVQDAIGELDLERELEPLTAAFEQVRAALDEYSPARLIQPIEQRVREAREALVAAVRLDQWRPALDDLAERALALLDQLDPIRLEGQIIRLLEEAKTLVDQMPEVRFGGWLGSVLTALLTGTGGRVYPWSFEAVLGWLESGSGAAALNARAAHIADAVARTRSALEAVDVGALSVGITARVQAVRPGVARLSAELPAGSPARDQLAAAMARLEVEVVFGGLAANRQRYLAAVVAAATLGETLRRTGLSDAEVALGQLRAAFDPLRAVTGLLRDLLAHMGITGFEGGLRGVLREALAVAPPARLAGLALPVFRALHGRIEALLQAVLTPVREAIDALQELVEAIDLQPLSDAVDDAYREVLAQVDALDPARLLKEPLQAFSSLQDDLRAFDPLSGLITVLEALRDTAARVLTKLSAQEILASPLAIYDHVLGELAKLDLGSLLGPVLDQLDAIALQVDVGLDETVEAFERLQQALPAGGGGSSASVSISA
jgi:hypothetical protein